MDIAGVEVVREYRLRLTFEDGMVGEVDFAACEWSGVFEPLREPAYFARASVEPEAGTIAWPNGADMAPEPLYEQARTNIVEAASARADRAAFPRPGRRLAAIVEQSDDAIQASNREGGITAWNRGAERLYGHSASEALGQHVSALAPPDQREVEEATLLRVAAGETARYETQRCRKDGTLVEVSVTSSPIRGASGRITGTSAIARDIGGRKRLERQLRNLANHDPLTGLLNRRV